MKIAVTCMEGILQISIFNNLMWRILNESHQIEPFCFH